MPLPRRMASKDWDVDTLLGRILRMLKPCGCCEMTSQVNVDAARGALAALRRKPEIKDLALVGHIQVALKPSDCCRTTPQLNINAARGRLVVLRRQLAGKDAMNRDLSPAEAAERGRS